MSDVAEWSMLPWHSALWDAMNLARSQLPHACLFVGQPGIGKVAFARHLGASLLCERPEPGGHACGQCPSCGWIAAACHPDYILVRPDAVGLAEKARQAIDDDALSEESTLGEGEDLERKTKHAPSKEIRIDQIRALADTLAVSSHRGGLRGKDCTGERGLRAAGRRHRRAPGAGGRPGTALAARPNAANAGGAR